MRFPDTEVTSIASLIDALKRLSPLSAITWFRGQANSEWTLIPGIARNSQLVTSESTLITRFKQNATMYLVDGIPKDEWDWIFLMQHYRAPTRLLDWSESPLVALYFALVDKLQEDSDGALWCMDPIALNRIANGTVANFEKIRIFLLRGVD